MKMKNFYNRDLSALDNHFLIQGVIQLVAIILCVVVFLGLNTVARQTVIKPGTWINIVDGHSMDATLHHKQKMFAERTGNFDYYDIVCARMPRAVEEVGFTYDEEDPMIVKRVIGRPGDHVQIFADNTVKVNEQIINEPYLSENALNNTYMDGTFGLHMDTILADNEYFLMGDNRGNSMDSRTFGPVTEEEMVSVLSLKPTKMFVMKCFIMLLMFLFSIWIYDIASTFMMNVACNRIERKRS